MYRAVLKIVLLFVILAAIGAMVACLIETAFGDELYVICKPGTEVYARISPRMGAEVVGHYDCGDRIETDGIERNGFIHAVDVGLEVSEAWISKRYLVEDRPLILEIQTIVVSSCRVRARSGIDGRRLAWLKPGQEVTVFARSDEWCVTNKGFVRTEFLGVN